MMIDLARTGPIRMGLHLDAFDHATGERTIKEAAIWFDDAGTQIEDEDRIADLEATHKESAHGEPA